MNDKELIPLSEYLKQLGDANELIGLQVHDKNKNKVYWINSVKKITDGKISCTKNPEGTVVRHNHNIESLTVYPLKQIEVKHNNFNDFTDEQIIHIIKLWELDHYIFEFSGEKIEYDGMDIYNIKIDKDGLYVAFDFIYDDGDESEDSSKDLGFVYAIDGNISGPWIKSLSNKWGVTIPTIIEETIKEEQRVPIIIEETIKKKKRATIIATNESLKTRIKIEIAKSGNEADLNHVDVSKVTVMKDLFRHTEFNGDISKWDISNVTDISGIFLLSNFEGDISDWDISNVTNMNRIDMPCKMYKHISKWGLGKLKGKGIDNIINYDKDKIYIATNNNLQELIICAISKYGPDVDLNNINVSEVTNMGYLFRIENANYQDMCAYYLDMKFNGNVSNWDVSKVIDMSGLFSNLSFNGDISRWKPVRLINTDSIFSDTENTNKWNNEELLAERIEILKNVNKKNNTLISISWWESLSEKWKNNLVANILFNLQPEKEKERYMSSEYNCYKDELEQHFKTNYSTSAVLIQVSELKEIMLDSYFNESLKPLGALINLNKVILLNNKKSFTPISNLINLKSLTLTKNTKDLKVLSKLPSLETLMLYGNKADLSPISRLLNLKKLEIRGWYIRHNYSTETITPNDQDLSPLKNLTKLEELDIKSSSPNMFPIYYLLAKTNLKIDEIGLNEKQISEIKEMQKNKVDINGTDTSEQLTLF